MQQTTATSCVIRHTHDDEQQQQTAALKLQHQHNSNTEKQGSSRNSPRADTNTYSCQSSALCAASCRVQSQDQEWFVEICEAFPTMGNTRLNHAQIEIMPVFWAKKQKKDSRQRDDATTTDADPIRVRRVEQAEESPGNRARRVGLSSSYLEDNSKPSLNRTLRPLACKRQHICTCIYISANNSS